MTRIAENTTESESDSKVLSPGRHDARVLVISHNFPPPEKPGEAEAHAIVGLSRHAQLRRTLGVAVWRRALHCFSAEREIAQLQQIVESQPSSLVSSEPPIAEGF